MIIFSRSPRVSHYPVWCSIFSTETNAAHTRASFRRRAIRIILNSWYEKLEPNWRCVDWYCCRSVIFYFFSQVVFVTFIDVYVNWDRSNFFLFFKVTRLLKWHVPIFSLHIKLSSLYVLSFSNFLFLFSNNYYFLHKFGHRKSQGSFKWFKHTHSICFRSKLKISTLKFQNKTIKNSDSSNLMITL